MGAALAAKSVLVRLALPSTREPRSLIVQAREARKERPMDKTLDLDELERVAREATQGEWVSFDRDTASNIYSAGNNGSLLAVCHSYTTDVSEKRPNAARRKANATYIATFDPPTVLTLIAAARPAVVSDEVVERMEAAYWWERVKLQDDDLDFPPHRFKAMRAALALLPGGVVPDGYVLVPRELTEAMQKAGQAAADDMLWRWKGLGERPDGTGLDGMTACVSDAYRAMLSASPKDVSPTQKDPHHGR